ncbi:molybdopterin-binding protein [Ovoidimarina sediminis]|uniref:molybdopterin-binding protein n=1 Tax=Ovoidimarina sediminis TaxID=3079856 RepID=UPI00290631B1|nr:molybdopterin-binding protein [Rhodophyticola sp. MJ-SS7]MDU8943519.1 molybdopterin-binding protein [Rhodophyticola sp. MJ-SS7]
MSGFDTVLVVDWSGGNDTGPRPRKDAIWTAAARAGAGDAPLYHRNRDAAMDWIVSFLANERAAGRRVLAGFDFPFGLPDGTTRTITGADDPLSLWDWLQANLTDTGQTNDRYALAARLNALFPGHGPFWFNGTGQEIPGLPHRKFDRSGPFGVSETRAAEEVVPGAFSPWQLGGAGAVGSQLLTGLARLAKLRTRFAGDIAVWPFEAPEAGIVLAEIYPSMLRDAVSAALQTDPDEIKDRAQVRLLARALSRLAAGDGLSEALAARRPPGAAREGWILGTGIEDRLAAAARPDIAPPKLRDDCFALPAGVDWVQVDEALERLQSALTPVTATEILPVAEADSRILAEDHHALRSNPPTPNAAVDGYGFAHAATGAGAQILPLEPGRAAAGVPFAGRVPEGRALRILTGAALPDGVDTVILEEDTTVKEGHIAFDGPVKPGANTRKAGEDVVEGNLALPAGRRLAPQDLALLSALGLGTVTVRTKLRAAVLSTGDELLNPGTPAGPGKIFDANRPMLLSLLDRWHHAPVDLGIAPDDEEAVIAALDRGARQADVILTSGGASAGDEDHMSRILREQGRVTAWRIALKPGRPLMLGHWKDVPVIGMPGNPVAAFVCALIFARPALSRLAGAAWSTPRGETRPAAFSKNKKPGRREYLRARLDEAGAVEVFKSEGSGRISGLSWATGLVEIGDAAEVITPGDPVRYLPFSAFGL